MSFMRVVAIGTILSCAAGSAFGIANGQVDDFNALTAAGWEEGPPSPNQPFVVNSGGPDGSAFLRNESSGGGGPGSRMVMFNRAQWSGDYLSAGVTTISTMMRASSSGPALDMRLGFDGLDGQYVTPIIVLPNDDQWHTLVFDITPGNLLLSSGIGNPADTLNSVFEMRIMHAPLVDYNGGAALVAQLDVDDIRAIPGPGGVVVLGLGAVLGMRRRRAG